MKADPVILAEGGPEDLGAVMRVMDDSFDPRFGEGWTFSQCAGLLVMPGVWLTLARRGGEVVGFALARAVAAEAELLLLAVRRDAQGSGTGKLLLDGFAERAKKMGVRRVHLEVREGNHAVKLYEADGYCLVGRRSKYYSGRSGSRFDALTLARDLPE